MLGVVEHGEPVLVGGHEFVEAVIELGGVVEGLPRKVGGEDLVVGDLGPAIPPVEGFLDDSWVVSWVQYVFVVFPLSRVH